MGVQLPDGLECDHCVLQWRYHTGNSWGTDENGHSGLGFGYQEEFYGCSDLEIVATGSSKPTPKPTTRPTTQTSAATSRPNWSTNAPIQTTQDPILTPKPTNPPVDPPITVSFCFGRPDGMYGNPFDCNKFYQCVGGNSFEVACPPGLYFNGDELYCDWPENVNC